MKKFLILSMIVIMLCSSSFVYALDFSDFNSSHWAYKYVNELTNQGVINGYPDGTFKSQGTVTRGEYIKLIVTASMGDEMFKDMLAVDHWATPYVTIAKRMNILMTDVTIENVDEPITRLEMAVILAYADQKFRTGEIVESTYEFSDTKEVHEWYLKLIGHTVERGLINGYPDGTFNPDGYMTRAEAATVIYRYLGY